MLPKRRSIRLRNFDYSQPGAYFVTICTHGRVCAFGRVVDAAMQLSDAGLVVQAKWLELVEHYDVELDAFVVMPNHVHGIVGLPGPGCNAAGLSEVVRGFKTFSAREVNRLLGTSGQPTRQRGFYDHVIRTERALERIREYIEENPGRWFEDRENPELPTGGLETRPYEPRLQTGGLETRPYEPEPNNPESSVTTPTTISAIDSSSPSSSTTSGVTKHA